MQTQLGWSTVKMSRHYTDFVPEEDRRQRIMWGRCCPRPGPGLVQGRPEAASTYSGR
jgi:hypothetical protein